MLRVIRFLLRLLGLFERVRGHTRMGGLVRVAAYWRRA